MPRASKSAAVLIALVLATAGIGAVSALTVSSSAPTATIGSTTTVWATFNGGSRHTVYLFAGTAEGTSLVPINGRNVAIPIGGSVFAAGARAIRSAAPASITASIPSDEGLVGSKIMWIAVVVDDATGRVVAIARSGGPIIEDAIC